MHAAERIEPCHHILSVRLPKLVRRCGGLGARSDVGAVLLADEDVPRSGCCPCGQRSIKPKTRRERVDEKRKISPARVSCSHTHLGATKTRAAASAAAAANSKSAGAEAGTAAAAAGPGGLGLLGAGLLGLAHCTLHTTGSRVAAGWMSDSAGGAGKAPSARRLRRSSKPVPGGRAAAGLGRQKGGIPLALAPA